MTDSSRAFGGLRVAPTLATLNEDILLELFLELTSKQLLNLISTCRRLFHTGLPALLARSYCPFGRQLRSFHRFLSFHAPESYLLLRQLRFRDGSGIEASDLLIIANILQHATNLHTLEISCDAFERCEAVATAITSLSKLRDISLIFEDVDISRSVLTRLNAPLVYLNLQIDQTDESPLPLLRNFCDTLEEVHLQYLDLPNVSFSCPKVTHLYLWFCDKPLLSVLTAVFPNLEVLSINSGYYDTPIGVQPYEELRTKNAALQPHARLPSLVSLTVDEGAMYTMNLQDEVDTVICPSLFRFSEAYECDSLRACLKSLRPRHLQLACWEDTSGLAKALSTGVERLDRLDLLVESGDNPFHVISDGIIDALKSLRIRMLSCKFTIDEPMDFIYAEGLAQGALIAAPTLAYIHITTCGNSYWIVVIEEKGAKQLRRVESESEISRMYQMFLPPQIQHSYCMESWYP